MKRLILLSLAAGCFFKVQVACAKCACVLRLTVYHAGVPTVYQPPIPIPDTIVINTWDSVQVYASTSGIQFCFTDWLIISRDADTLYQGVSGNNHTLTDTGNYQILFSCYTMNMPLSLRLQYNPLATSTTSQPPSGDCKIIPSGSYGIFRVIPCGNVVESVTVFDMVGRMVSNTTNPGPEINLESLAPGNYIYCVAERKGKSFKGMLLIQ